MSQRRLSPAWPTGPMRPDRPPKPATADAGASRRTRRSRPLERCSPDLIDLEPISGELAIERRQRRGLHQTTRRLHQDHRHGGAEIVAEIAARRAADRPGISELVEQGVLDGVEGDAAGMRLEKI